MEVMLAFTILGICLQTVNGQHAEAKCPPCPAKPPCKCRVETTVLRFQNSDGFPVTDSRFHQVLICREVALPQLVDDFPRSMKHWTKCPLRIENSSFTEISTNAFVNLQRTHIEITSNQNLQVIRSGSFGIAVTQLLVSQNPSLVHIDAGAFSGIRSFSDDGICHLVIMDNDRLASIDANTFSGADGIISLEIDAGASMRTVPAQLFKHLPHLESLTLAKGFVWLEEGAFDGMSQTVTDVDIRKTSINEIGKHGFRGMEGVTRLNIIGNRLLWSIHDDAFLNTPRLEGLVLRENSLNSLPLSLKSLRKLTYLNVGGNRLPQKEEMTEFQEFWRRIRSLVFT